MGSAERFRTEEYHEPAEGEITAHVNERDRTSLSCHCHQIRATLTPSVINWAVKG